MKTHEDCAHCGGSGEVTGEYPGVACSACCGTGKAPVKESLAAERHDNLPHMTPEQISARAKEFARRCKAAAADAENPAEQPEDGPVAWLVTSRHNGIELYDNEHDARRDFDHRCRDNDEMVGMDPLFPASAVIALRAERDALRREAQKWADEYRRQFSENEALRERVRELEADAARWHFVRQFMCLDDVGDEDFCLGLITYGESLSERVTPAASRLYKDRWDARCRAEYQGEELDQGEITVDEAIDAAMQEGE